MKKTLSIILTAIILFGWSGLGYSQGGTGIGTSYTTYKQRTTAPATPSSTYDRLYFYTGDILKYVNSAGVSKSVLVDGGAMSSSLVTSASSGTLSVANVTGTLITNYGQANDNTTKLPAIAAGLGFDFIAGTTVAKYFRIDPDDADVIVLDKTAGAAGKYIGWASIAEGDAVSCRSVQTGASAYKWFCYTIAGSLVAE